MSDMMLELRLTALRRNGVSVPIDLEIRGDSTAKMISRVLEVQSELNTVLGLHGRPQLTEQDVEALKLVVQSMKHASRAYSLWSKRPHLG